MPKAQDSEDALLSLAEPNADSNLDAAYRLTEDMKYHVLHLMEARDSILEIAGSDGVTDQTCSALRVIARDMERSLEAIDQLTTDVRWACLKERGSNRTADPAA